MVSVAKGAGPNVRQRRVARTLRQWRQARGFTLEDVRKALKWSESKVSRLERAEGTAGPAEVIALAAILGVDEASRDKVVKLAIAAAESDNLLGPYGPDAVRGDFRDYVEDEAETLEIHSVETTLVTGLLQTTGYAEAILRGWAPDIDDHVLSERRRLRRQRQRRLTDTQTPLSLHLIMHENALRLPIGGAKVMREQVEHLVARAVDPHITIQLLPASLGAYPGIGTSYHVVSFEQGVPGAVYLENLKGGLYLEEADDVEAYVANFQRLLDIALSPETSVRRMIEINEIWT
jgi:transcriptional regulator with XRE-family HTH domain